MTKKLYLWLILIILAAATVFAYFTLYKGKESVVKYRTIKVERGDLASFVTANGTVNPVTTVLVGTQVSGTIQKLYADYNSPVKNGQLIAQIDPATIQAQVSQAKAKLENSKAGVSTARADVATARSNVESSKANVLKAQVALADAKRNLDRSLELFRRNLISASDRDTAQTASDSAAALLEAAQAQQKAGEAQVESAKARLEASQAQVKQSQAELEQAQVNLDHTRITAPVNGTVISRNVDVGQTVAASLQAPTLFTIAQDLTEMQVDTNISEADIGRVAVGQETSFTVDAYPQMTFKGKVTEIRNAPTTIQNVVTYDVVIQVKNPDLKLKPGMTANASILVAHNENILKIPNAALRFRPDFAKKEGGAPQSQTGLSRPLSPPPAAPGPTLEKLTSELNLSPQQQARIQNLLQAAKKDAEAFRKLGPEEGRAKSKELRATTAGKIRSLLSKEQQKKYDQLLKKPAESSSGPAPKFKVWVPVPQGRPAAVDITTGISDGNFTEVLSGNLKEGEEIILEVAGKNNKGGAASQTASPSMRGFR